MPNWGRRAVSLRQAEQLALELWLTTRLVSLALYKRKQLCQLRQLELFSFPRAAEVPSDCGTCPMIHDVRWMALDDDAEATHATSEGHETRRDTSIARLPARVLANNRDTAPRPGFAPYPPRPPATPPPCPGFAPYPPRPPAPPATPPRAPPVPPSRAVWASFLGRLQPTAAPTAPPRGFVPHPRSPSPPTPRPAAPVLRH